MQLRYLGTLFDISSERSSLIVFPFPIELTQLLTGARRPGDGGQTTEGR
jgi:hypothetical protein